MPLVVYAFTAGVQGSPDHTALEKKFASLDKSDASQVPLIFLQHRPLTRTNDSGQSSSKSVLRPSPNSTLNRLVGPWQIVQAISTGATARAIDQAPLKHPETRLSSIGELTVTTRV